MRLFLWVVLMGDSFCVDNCYFRWGSCPLLKFYIFSFRVTVAAAIPSKITIYLVDFFISLENIYTNQNYNIYFVILCEVITS